MARRRYTQAINDALFEEMERDPKVIVFGEDVELAIFGDTRGLLERFGRDRIRNTPICEATLTGMAVGAAAAGYRVVLHMMFSNFLYTGGQLELPITIMSGYGGGRSNAAQHSDTPHSLLMNLGGLNVAVPATPADAKGLLKTAIRGRNPTFFMEASGQGGTSGEVPEGDYTVPFGKAAIVREGRDVSIIAIGTMLRPALAAAKQLEEQGVSAEVIDPRTLVPFDEETILRSVGKTGRAVVVDEGRDRASAASHIAAILADKAFGALQAPVKRVTVPNVAMPYAPNAEARVFPNEEQIINATLAITRAAAA